MIKKVPKDTVWSWSSLDAYNTCPYPYYATRILKEKVDEVSWAELGTHVHDILELVEKGELAAEDAQHVYFEELPPIHIPSMTDEYVAKLISECLQFFENLPKLDLGFENIVDVERDFIVDIGRGEKLRGFIDAEMIEDGKIRIRDWKTSSMSGFYGKKLAHKAKQLYLYSAAVKQEYGIFPTYLEFYMIRGQKPITIEFKESEYKEAITWALNTIEQIRNDETFEKKEDFFFCKNLCSSTSCENSSNYGKEVI